MKISEFGEEKIIELVKDYATLFHCPQIITGIGDDAAVIDIGDRYQLITTDMLVEDIHFDLRFVDPYSLGWKSLAVNLSDIAAMGGKPLYYLTSVSLPSAIDIKFVKELYAGMRDLAAHYRVNLIGGDTVGSKNKVVISIVVIGEVKKDEIIFRTGAKPGDGVYVSGFLGDSAAGLKILLENLKGELFPDVELYLVEKHLKPLPQIELGRKLAEGKICTGLNDVSDGLVKKTWEMAKASGVSIRIDENAIPISRELKVFAEKFEVSSLDFALHGGEDYELLFTAMPEKETMLKGIGFHVTRIGEVVDEHEGGKVFNQDGKLLEDEGFKHF